MLKAQINGLTFTIPCDILPNDFAVIPLYYSKSAFPIDKNIHVDYLIEDMQCLLPKKIDTTTLAGLRQWRGEILANFWSLLASHYSKYCSLTPSDAEYYVAVLSLLDTSILSAFYIGYDVNFKTLVRENRNLLCQVSQKYSIPLEIKFTTEKQTDYSLVFSNFPILVTKNLILRPFSTQDTNDLFHIFNDKDYVKEFNPSAGEISWAISHQSIIEFQQKFLEGYSIHWAVTKKDTGEIVGVRDLFFDSKDEPIETQGFFFPSYRNKGYNQEVLTTVIDFLQKVNSPSLVFNCSKNNAPVIHIASKLNFVDVTVAEGGDAKQKRRKYQLFF